MAARTDPLSGYSFLVEIGGIREAGFRECSGLGAMTEPVEVNEGGLNSASHKFVGRTKQNNIILKWGLTASDLLYDWYRQIVNGQIKRESGSIIILNRTGQRSAQWDFINGWPTRWDGPELNATSSEVVVETLEIAHEGLTRVKRN